MRNRWFALALITLFFGALGGAILAPQPAGAVSKDMVELQQQVSQILQGQQDLRSAMDSNNATIKTLVQQSIDSVNQMSAQMGAVQKTVQEVQANTGARIDTITQQTQGISDNLQDVQARVGKLSQQLTDIQNSLQSIDAKVSGSPTPGAEPAPGGAGGSYPPPSTSPTYPASPAGGSPSNYGAPNSYNSPNPYGAPPSTAANAPNSYAAAPSGMAPVSADTLYHNALRDYTTGNYDLSRQEFSDYIAHFPTTDLASNSQFYLGEIFYAQGNFKDAITSYDLVLSRYPQSLKLAAAQLKKGQAEIQIKSKTSGIRDLREVVQRFPGSDESRRARSLLQGMGVPVTAPRNSTSH
jgi:tol-pal system protein YbgF